MLLHFQERFIDVPNEQIIMPIIFVVLMLISGGLHVIPPETNNRQLPECLTEANMVRYCIVCR